MKTFATLTATIIAVTNLACAIVTQHDTLYYEYVNDADEPIDNYIYCSVKAPSVSLGEIIPLTKIVFDGENCAEIFVDLLEEEGLIPVYSGTTDEWFYLSAIEGIDTSQITIPDNIKAFLTEEGINHTENVSVEGTLGEFDLTDASGWIFTINGEMPSVGMCDYVPQIGDEIELIFTLNYGEDLAL